MKRSVVIAGIIILLISVTAFASSGSVGLWDADLSGSIKSGAGADEIDLKSDLGMGDDNITQFRLDLNLGGPKAYLHYYKAENSGSTGNPVLYNGVNLNNGPVKSKLEQTIIDINAEKTLVQTDELRVDLIGGLRYMDLKANLHDDSHSTSDSIKALVPTIGIGAQTHLTDDLVAKASISGLDISLNGKKVDTYDLKYGLEYQPTENLAIGAGIQKFKLSAEDGDSKGDLHREGNYFEVVIKF